MQVAALAAVTIFAPYCHTVKLLNASCKANRQPVVECQGLGATLTAGPDLPTLTFLPVVLSVARYVVALAPRPSTSLTV